MRQRIAHGTMLDVATPTEVASLIAAAFDKQRDELYRREKGAIPLDGTGAGTGTFKTTRQYDCIMERITIVPGANATIQIYANQIQASDLLEIISVGASGAYSDAFSNNIFVQAGTQVLLVVAGGIANGQAAFNVQTRLVKAL